MDRVQILLLALIGLAALWLAWQGAKLWLRRGIRVEGDVLGIEGPALLYFSSEACAPCRLQQAPAVASLRRMMGERARFHEYDAIEHQDLARHFRVLTVPTTVVLSSCGDVVAVNYGVTDAGTLQHQLEEAVEDCD